MKSNKWLFIVIIGVVISFAFNNCSNVEFTPIDDSTSLASGGDASDPVVIAKKCENSTQVSQHLDISFPDPGIDCDWNVNGNLGKIDQYFQARREQNFDFQLPNDAIICDMKFNFPDQSFYYDDNIIMAFNNKILASSYNWDALLSKDSLGMAVYDWNSIVGKKWDQSPGKMGVFCAGMNEGLSTCAWPKTQASGTISMAFDKSIIQKVMASSGNISNHTLKFVTTGDNDTTDCRHTSIRFSLDVKYVQ